MKRKIELTLLFRSPICPVIVVSRDRLYSSKNLEGLVRYLLLSGPLDGENYVKVIDSTGEEFWYYRDRGILSPGFVFKKWTKRRIIDLFNESINSKEIGMNYPNQSISSKRLSRIIGKISELIAGHNKGTIWET